MKVTSFYIGRSANFKGSHIWSMQGTFDCPVAALYDDLKRHGAEAEYRRSITACENGSLSTVVQSV
jgi:hypothetical protein